MRTSGTHPGSSHPAIAPFEGRWNRGWTMRMAAAGALRASTSLVLAIGLIACAAERKTGEAAKSPCASNAPAASGGAVPPPGYPSQDDGNKTALAPEAAPPPTTSEQPSTPFAPPPPNRAAVMRQASSDIDVSQRELDVAGGDCRNACRALGSMDRA